MSVRVGAATRVINCELGDDLSGQLHPRFCRRIRDDLEANVLYLSDATTPLVLVSLDLLGMFDRPWVEAARRRMGRAADVPERNVLLTSTHTHAGPETFGLLFDRPRNEAYLERLTGWLVEAAAEAAERAVPARVGSAAGRAHVGHNRRMCWQDGSHSMYGDADRPDFTGLEGPDDPTHSVLSAVDEAGEPLVVVHNNCCHATCLESEDYASADFPCEARRLVRDAVGGPVPVLYLQGASGDISPWNMLRTPYHYSGERRVREVGATLASETLRLMHLAEPTAEAPVRHAFEDLELAVRLPSPEAVARAEQMEAAGLDAVPRWEYVIAVSGVLRLVRLFQDDPRDRLAVHAVRIGELAIATNPCELYCQFGLDIRRRSPAPVTMISQLTDGFSGYCSTVYAQAGGGYSGDPIHWTRLEPHAGHKLVEATARLLHGLWRG